MHHACGSFNITGFQNDRSSVQAQILTEFRDKIESVPGDNKLYSDAVEVQLKNLEIPISYSAAVAQKQKAEEDIDLAKNQRAEVNQILSLNATSTLKRNPKIELFLVSGPYLCADGASQGTEVCQANR